MNVAILVARSSYIPEIQAVAAGQEDWQAYALQVTELGRGAGEILAGTDFAAFVLDPEALGD
jgi:hypothetical protein